MLFKGERATGLTVGRMEAQLLLSEPLGHLVPLSIPLALDEGWGGTVPRAIEAILGSTVTVSCSGASEGLV